MSNKIVVDLDHPVWLSEPGYRYFKGDDGNYCALGKALIASGHTISSQDSYYEDFALIMFYLSIGVARSIAYTNDNLGTKEGFVMKPENHWKAVKMVLEELAKNPNVELKGTKVHDVLKEKVNA